MFEVKPAESWESYRSAWMRRMGHVPWFNSSRLFDYDLQEELGELEEGFGEGNLFLVARSESSSEPIGVLSVFDILRGNGCRFAYLGTHVDNRAALGLYEGVGFERVFFLLTLEKELV